MTRVFFVADLHGSAVCFRKFINAARIYKADVLLVGGDVAAKTMTPVFPEGTGWIVTSEGETRRASSAEELAKLEASLRDSATLPLRTTPTEWDERLADRAKADRAFEALALDDLRRWLAWAKERLTGVPTRLLIGLGNDELTPMERVIANDDRVELTNLEILRFDPDHEMLTIPYSNPTPWKTHRELSEEELARRIDELAARLEDPARAVFNIHVPPFGTPLDLAPRLQPDLTKTMSPGGETEIVHVGSTAVREALERHHPLLSLHGHIHESRGTTPFGRTLSLNCGSAYTEGTLLGALVDLERDRVRSAVLSSG